MKRFEQDLYSFFTDRIQAAGEFQRKDPEYQRTNEEFKKIVAEIEAIVGRDLMLKLDNCESKLVSIDTDYAYKQGFYDGMRLEGIVRGIIPESANDNYEE